MLNNLLQIASFKSGPQNFTTGIFAVIVVALLFTGVQGYALSLSPGNELIRMFVASFLKVLVLGLMLLAWLRSINAETHFKSVLMVMILSALMAEIIKMPLNMMIRNAETTSDVTTAALMSIPLIAIVVWQYSVWYYSIKQVVERHKLEIITVIIVISLISEVVGFVLSKIGQPVEGF